MKESYNLQIIQHKKLKKYYIINYKISYKFFAIKLVRKKLILVYQF